MPSLTTRLHQAAGARRTAEAATNIRDYGSKIATVASYDAPVNTTDLAIQANKTGIMPAEVADRFAALRQ